MGGINLNVGLTGNARAKFKTAKILKLDVWRRIVAPMGPKAVAKRVELHTEVHALGKSKSIGKFPEHLEAWQRQIDQFIFMGGSEIPDEEKCVIVLKQLRPDILASMAMALEDHMNYDDLKDKIDKQVQFLNDFQGSHNLRASVVDVEHEADGGARFVGDKRPLGADVLDLTEMDELTQATILAPMRGRG